MTTRKDLRKALYVPFEGVSHIVYVHGFFQKNDGCKAEPIALIESEDGKIYEVMPNYLTFQGPPTEEKAMTTKEQEKAFLKGVIEWIANNMRPEDVFTEDQLEEWAEATGYEVRVP